jgi:hypothetical protein
MDVTKMAEDVALQVEDALNSIVKLTNESGNLKKELRKSIHESVSNLRNLMYVYKNNLNEKTRKNIKLKMRLRRRRNYCKLKQTHG